MTTIETKPIKPGDVRYLADGRNLTCIAVCDGYVMARQAAVYPTVYTARAWNQLLN